MWISDAEKLHEECAVFGISINKELAANYTCNALLAMQHRGQEGAGIAVLDGYSIICRKNEGLVNDVFSEAAMSEMPPARIGIGHTRYSTSGNNNINNVQPFVIEFLTGRIATAHNGNIINAAEIRNNLGQQGINFSASSDSEVISSLIAYHIVQNKDVEKGVIDAVKQLAGAFSLVIMSSEGKLIAVRDPQGFRPLCIGYNDLGYAVASESCALDSCGFTMLRDLEPGEMVVIENGAITRSGVELHSERKGFCIFEYIYFARPDSVIDGLSVFKARYNMGAQLAKEYPVDADMVCGVPDSGLEAAMGYAAESGIPLATGFVKNRYIGRSFIYPSQWQRENAVGLKLSPLKASVEGKRIVLIDDSIVRGTTSAKIVASLRRVGVKEIHMRISAPPFRHACYFGVDIDREEELIANKISLEELREKIEVDSLGFISEEGLKLSCKESQRSFCMGCFNGEYGMDVNRSSGNKFELQYLK